MVVTKMKYMIKLRKLRFDMPCPFLLTDFHIGALYKLGNLASIAQPDVTLFKNKMVDG